MLYKGSGSLMFPKLFEPGYIGKLKLKNRLVKAPTGTFLATPDGCVTERMVRHYRELARGGVGLIIVEFSYVDEKASKAQNCQLGVSCDYHRAGLDWLASTMKMHDAMTCLQISHAGNQRGLPGAKTVSRFAWGTQYARGMAPPQELTFEELGEIIEAFGNAAARAKMAGFDMVEVHGCHGYLITNSLSPRVNRRTDWYGGKLKNRMRLLLEVIESIRKKAGPDYPVSVRLSGTDYEKEEPITIEETKEVAKALEKAGVNVIHVSGGTQHTGDKLVVNGYWPLAYNVWAAEEIKRVVSIPVIASGAVTSPALAEKILEEEKGDFIGLARPLWADPYFPMKAKEGRPEDIHPCIRCCDGCRGGGVLGRAGCSVNVALFKEGEFEITPVARPKQVAVIGGGPAGMEAARVAASIGHKVTLYEKRKLGGMLIEASVPEFKADIRSLIDYLSTQLEKTGVTVVYDEAKSQTIKDGKFDVVIVASGATAPVPDIPGIDEPYVITALDVLNGAKIGDTVVVVGGGMIGCDVALFLAEQGKEVTITTRRQEIAEDMGRSHRAVFFERLSKQKVTMCPSLRLEKIAGGTAIFSEASGARREIKADTIVLAAGLTPNTKLFDELTKMPDLECYAVGDCVMPGMIFDAIHDGHQAARALV